MRRLTGLDASFLHLETPTMHMHVVAMLVLDTTSMPGGYRFEVLRDTFANQARRVRLMRSRLMEVPFELGQPVWAEEADIDVDKHVKRLVLTGDTSWDAAERAVGEIAGRALDRSRPLWEYTLIEGLDDGRVVFVAKLHHSIVDGVSGANVMAKLYTADAGASDKPAAVREVEPPPSRWNLFTDAVAEQARWPQKVAKAIPEVVSGAAGLVGSLRDRSGGEPSRGRASSGVGAPRTSFNGTLSALRCVATGGVALDEVKAIKDSLNARREAIDAERAPVRLNDVALALCAGAVRRYLDDRGELPNRPLTVACPVSVHGDQRAADVGGVNRLAAMFVTLPVHLADPFERIEAVRTSSSGARATLDSIGGHQMMVLANLVAPWALRAGSHLYSQFKLADHHPVVANLVLSNVAGPQFDLFLGGAKVERIHPFGPLLEGSGINLTVLSYGGLLGVGFMACPKLVPEPRSLVDAFYAEHASLCEATHVPTALASRPAS
jgi:WS/DGAT/MGAT family acyltransferase